MKERNYLTISIVCTLVIVFVFSFYVFVFHGGISQSTNDWSNFGSYFGGVAGSILSFINILLLIYTIANQDAKKNEEKQNDNHKRDIERFNTYITMLEKYENFSCTTILSKIKHHVEINESIERKLLNYLSQNRRMLAIFENALSILNKSFGSDTEEKAFYQNVLDITVNDEIKSF